MAQPLLHREQHAVAGGDMQDAAMVEPDPGKRRSEKVSPVGRPDHGAGEACEDAGHHQGGGARMFLSGSGIGDLMQAAEGEAAAG